MKVNYFSKNKKQWILFLLCMACLPNLIAQSYTKEERIHCLSMLWKDASTKFHNPERLQQVNWDSLYVVNVEQAIGAKNDKEYYQLLEKFIAVLNDGHSEINIWEWISDNENTGYLPIGICAIGENYYVWRTLIKNIDEIPIGSKILKINDLPSFDYLQKYIFPYIPAQTKQDKIQKALSYLIGRNISDSITFTIQTMDGDIRFLRQFEMHPCKSGKSIFSNSDLCTTNFRLVKGCDLYFRRR
jgi:hypothetical protein